jgi:hypothetical protein
VSISSTDSSEQREIQVRAGEIGKREESENRKKKELGLFSRWEIDDQRA